MEIVNSIAAEDASMYGNSVFCVALKNAEIVGAAKVSLWTEGVMLPIQSLFNINPSVFKEVGVKSIWHIGRFAVSQNEKNGAKLLRRLIALAIFPICNTPGSIMLAECDSKFVKVLNLLGIRTEILAKGINYLGSETIPIYSTQEWLSVFLNKSSHHQEAIDFYVSNNLGASYC